MYGTSRFFLRGNRCFYVAVYCNFSCNSNHNLYFALLNSHNSHYFKEILILLNSLISHVSTFLISFLNKKAIHKFKIEHKIEIDHTPLISWASSACNNYSKAFWMSTLDLLEKSVELATYYHYYFTFSVLHDTACNLESKMEFGNNRLNIEWTFYQVPSAFATSA